MHLEEKDLTYIWHPCSQMKDYETLPPKIIVRGQGVYLYDRYGTEYLDIVSSWWCNLLGHCNPTISKRIQAQLDTLEHVIFANFSHEGAIQLCEELANLLPKGLTKFHFSDNGSASVECALKMAFQYQNQIGRPEKQRFMCLTNGYHGETIGALSVGTMDLYAKLYQPMLMDTIRIEAPDCYRCPYGRTRDSCSCECFENAEAAFAEYASQTAAMIVEPLLQGSAGMRIYPSLYLKKLRDLCTKLEVLLIADEIATGFGRTGKMFACEHAGITPDIICLSKGLTGGYLPMSLTVTTEIIYRAFYADYGEGKALLHSHTYSGNPLGCAAALAVLQVFREEPILEDASANAEDLGELMQEAFGNHPHVGEIRSIGLIYAMELVKTKETKEAFAPELRMGYQIYREALELGLVLRPLGDVLYFNPPLNIGRDELKKAVERTKEAMRRVLG